jgi:uncharacterized DUF497 family protein
MASVRTVELDETADRNYDCPVRIEPDPAKSERNARSRGLSFELVAGFDWETAVYREDSRRAYPERRIVALGSVGPRLCVGAQASEGVTGPPLYARGGSSSGARDTPRLVPAEAGMPADEARTGMTGTSCLLGGTG